MSDDFRPIPGFEGSYSISPDGQVRSEQRRLIRRNGSPYKVQARVLRQPADRPGGHVRLALCGECTTVWPHLVVREVFGDD